MRRWLGFLIAIGVGIAIGLVYGWVVNPVEYVDTAPASLREDFKTDYVLMVAEAYLVEDDLALAVRRLALMGGELPEEMVRQATISAANFGYAQADLNLMQALRKDLLTWNPAVEVTPDEE